MIKVTFQAGSGMYWAVCERAKWCNDVGVYELDSMAEDSRGMGPATWILVPQRWHIMTVEEA